MKVDYVDHMGSDLTVVNSARVSFDKESEWLNPQVGQKGLKHKDQRLVHYLANHGHFTPFTHPQITLRETVPIFVARQRFKHMVGFTYNEVSRRYVDDEPEFYVPDVWRSRPEGSVKQGSGEAIELEFKPLLRNQNEELVDYTGALKELYQLLLDQGVAPEQARMVLPQSMYTSYYCTGSLAAFARAYKQRIDAHAQKEIQDLAVQWDTIIRPLFPVSWEALTK